MASDNDWIVPSFYEEGNDVQTPFGRGDIEAELVRFREQWSKELAQQEKESTDDSAKQMGHPDGQGQCPSIEEEARYLFLQGVNSEQCHRLYEAIQYYRRAVQLVPDIEFRITDYSRPALNNRPRTRLESESSENSLNLAEEEEEDLSNLIQHFSKLTTNTVCQQQYEHGNAHISDLPAEVILYILQWVVSSELDVASLERVALVSRGFYLAARDEELWRHICVRLWGVQCGGMKVYGSWRNMYLNRPHLNFNGCYISRMSYYRQGEHSLDSLYRPFHLVEYYRYVRFFPEGKVMMLVTPDDPYSTVPELRSRTTRVQGLLTGYYKLTNNKVTAVLTRKTHQDKATYRYKRQRRTQDKSESEQLFYVEFELQDSNRNKQNQQLSWVHYSIRTKYKATGQESESEFELSKQTYPNLIFSRVKSYTAEAKEPLTALRE